MGKTYRHTLGIVLNEIEASYQSLLYNGFMEYSETDNVQLLFIVGKSLHSPYEQDLQHNVIYTLLDSQRIDGFILASGSIGNFSSREDLKVFCKKLKPRPMVSLTLELDGHSSILLDNKSSINELVNHLIHVHNYKKIGFLRGPENSPDAEFRYVLYREAMKNNNLEIPAEWIFSGDFTYMAGSRLASRLLANSLYGLDAVMCANDEMAYALIRGLQDGGVRVPGDIAVTGFDDLGFSSGLTPSITTIHHPIQEKAFLACKTLVEHLDTPGEPVTRHLKSRVVLRESCGCKFLQRQNQKRTGPINDETKIPADLPLKKKLRMQQDFFIESLKNQIQQDGPIKAGILEDALSDLYQALLVDISLESLPSAFNTLFSELMSHSFFRLRSYDIIRQIIFSFRAFFLENMDDDRKKAYINDVFYSSLNLLSHWIEKRETEKTYTQYGLYFDLKKFSDNFNALLTMEELLPVLKKILPEIRVHHCFIMLLDSPKPIEPEFSYPETINCPLILSPGIPETIKIPAFETNKIYPDLLLNDPECKNLLLMPLFNRNYCLGYILFSLKDLIPLRGFETIREQISIAIDTAYTISQLRNESELMEKDFLTLKKNRDSIQNIIQDLPIAIINCNGNNEISYFNQTAQDLLAVEKDKQYGKLSIESFIIREDWSKFQNNVQKTLGGKSCDFFIVHFKDDESINETLLTLRLQKQENGNNGYRIHAIPVKLLTPTMLLPSENFFEKFRITKREKEILSFLLQSYTLKGISEKLNISMSTVKSHITNIYDKTGSKNKSALLKLLEKY